MILKLLIAVLLGAISGFIAGKIMKSEGGLLRDIVLGIIGGFVGDLVLELIGVSFSGYLGTIFVSVIGACLVIFVVNKVLRK